MQKNDRRQPGMRPWLRNGLAALALLAIRQPAALRAGELLPSPGDRAFVGWVELRDPPAKQAALVGLADSTHPTKTSPDVRGDQPRGSAEGLLTASGRVLLPDGSPAAGVVVCARSGNSSAGVATVHTDEKGQFRLRHEFGWGASLNAHTNDWRLQSALGIPRERARAAFFHPVEIRLAPAREQLVSVTFQNRPVEGARVVAADKANYQVPALTDRDGKALLRLAAGTTLNSVVAWHPAFGAGGQLFGMGGATARSDGPLHLELLPAKSHIIRVVDGQGEPVPGLELGVACRVTDWIMTRQIDSAHVRTDRRGEAVVPWLPRDAKFVNVDIVDPRWKLDATEWKIGQTVVKLRRKYPVTGRLTLPPGANAEGILVTGTGFGAESIGGVFHVDVPSTRARADGSFTLLAVPDHGYAIGVADSEWASDPWTGLILASEKATPTEVHLTASRATPLSVHVTRGPQRTPVAGAWISLRMDQPFTWKDAHGQHHRAQGGVQSGIETDEHGTALFSVGKGTQSVNLFLGNWRDERSVKVASSTPVSIDFNRPWSDKRTIAGQLTLKHKPHKRGPATIVRAWSTKNPSIGSEGVALPDGRFTVGIDAEDVYVFATDSSERLGGTSHVGPAGSAIKLELAPSGSYSGIVVDSNGRPRAGHGVELTFRGPGFMDMIVLQSQISDAQGRFKFDGVPVQTSMAVMAGEPLSAFGKPYSTRPNDFHVQKFLEFYLDSGEVRQNVKLVAEPGNAEGQTTLRSTSPRESLEQHVNRLTRDVRLAGMRLLVILQGDASKSLDEFTQQVVDPDDDPEILRYLTLTVSPKEIQSEAALLSRLGWERPKPGRIEMIAIDGSGAKLAAQSVAGTGEAAAREAAQFVKRNAPVQRNAQALFLAALREARESERRLLIVEGGPRCGPCFQMARWMDDQHELLAKEYVILKILATDENSRAVIRKFNPPRNAGIPWFAIAEPDGPVLATSDSPLGNTGFPTSFEEKRHLKKMLDRTARHLTAAEREQLIKSLPTD